MPLLALPPISVNVVLEKAVPIVDDAYVYEKIVGDSFGDPVRANLALDLFLRNDEAFPVTINHVTLTFGSPSIPSIVLASGLQMWCEGVATQLDAMSGLIMPAGAKCRLGLTPNPILALPAPAELTMLVAYDGILNGTVIPLRALRSYRNSTPTGAYRLPVKAEDLASGRYWFGQPSLSGWRHRFKSRTENSEVFAYDMTVRRRDVWNSSEELEPGDTDPLDENDDFICWGLPIYAMADGEVLGFEGSKADNEPGTAPDDAANFFSIRHGDEIAWYGHLRQFSLNPHLTAIGAVVKEGQFLGTCGNSGNSSVPHLHVQVTLDGEPVPLQFDDAFLVEQSAFGPGPVGNLAWNAFKGAGLSPSTAAIWPSGLRRRGSASDVAITDVAIVGPSSSRTLTAARTLGGNLRVSSWSTDNTGEAVLLDTEIGGGVSKVSLAVPNGSTDGALAMITSAGVLKLSGLDIDGSALTRTVDSNSNAAKDVAAASAPFPKGIVTAVRTQTDELKVIARTVDPGGATIVRGGSAGGGVIEEVAVARTFGFPGVVTAVRNSNGKLELLSFRFSANGATVTREDDVEDFAADQISITRLGLRPNGDDLVVTASRNASGDLELISWSIEADGDIVRLQRLSLGGIGEVSAARSSASHLLTAISDQNGDYELIAWRVDEDGNFTRRTETWGGPATAIAQEGTKTTGGLTLAVSAMAGDGGILKLIVHQVQLTD